MSNELISNLIHTIYLTFDHNNVVIAYIAGFIFCVILSLWRPSRHILLTMLGFLILATGFEYDKHLVGPLIRQTLGSVVREPGNYVSTTKLINIFLGEIVPVMFFVFGWFLIFLGILVATRAGKKRARNKNNLHPY